MQSSFLITSATGRQGGSAARLLLEKGVIVHALVRDEHSKAAEDLKKLGAILFEGDFDNVSAIQAASKGVSGIFLNLWPTPDPKDQLRQARAFIDAAKANNVPTMVVSTAFLTGRPELWANMPDFKVYYDGKAAVEDAVRQAGFPAYTILRPSFLMHNYLLPDSQYHFPELHTDGVLAHAYEPGRRMPHLDAADVGKFAAEALLQPDRFNGHEIELGFESLAPEEALEALNRVSGQQIALHKRTLEEIEAKRQQLPTLPFQILANDVDLSIDGDSLQKKYGISCCTFSSFLEREKSQLGKSLPQS